MFHELCPKHERDERIEFKEKTHTYFIDGDSTDIISVTTFIHTLFREFNADEAILKMRNGRYWMDKKEYHGMTDDQIKEKWENHRERAADLGTRMHNFLELFFKGAKDNPLNPELISRKQLYRFLSAHRKYLPYKLEPRIFDEGTRIAGSVDALFLNVEENPGVIETEMHIDPITKIETKSYKLMKKPLIWTLWDWKRYGKVRTENPYDSALPGTPIEGEPNANFFHATLQLNMYKYILEKNYGMVIGECAVVHFHPNNDKDEYRKYPILDMQETIEKLFAFRRQHLFMKKFKIPRTIDKADTAHEQNDHERKRAPDDTAEDDYR